MTTLCSSSTLKTEDTLLLCDSCNKCQNNCKKCHKLPKTFIDLLAKFEKQGARWNCPSCTTKIDKTDCKLNDILDKVTTLSEPISDLASSLKLSFAEVTSGTNKLSDIVAKSNTLPVNQERLIQSTIDLILTKQFKLTSDNIRREVNHIIRRIDDSVNLDEYMELLYKNTLHCPIPITFSKLGLPNDKYTVSRKIVKITYASLAAKLTVC